VTVANFEEGEGDGGSGGRNNCSRDHAASLVALKMSLFERTSMRPEFARYFLQTSDWAVVEVISAHYRMDLTAVSATEIYQSDRFALLSRQEFSEKSLSTISRL